MYTSIGNQQRIYHSKVDKSGRIVLPADVRLRHHIQTGDQMIIIEGEDGLQVKTREQALREAQSLFAELAPSNVLLSEALIRERRQEAEHE